jgi:hypothetical protein
MLSFCGTEPKMNFPSVNARAYLEPTMDGLATERLALALTVLDSLYGCTVKVTNAEIETLKKSYLAGDVTGLKIEEIAVAVIHEELDCLKAAQQRAKIA